MTNNMNARYRDFSDSGFNDDKGNGAHPQQGGNNGATNNANPLVQMLASNGAQNTQGIQDILIDYNDKFLNATPSLFRDAAIDSTLACLLSKKKPNALLVGPAGVGKTAIVEEIARRIATKDISIPDNIADKTIYELPLSALVAGAGVVGQIESRIEELITFASDPANNAILFIDEIHLLAPEEGGSGSTYGKISQILKPAMARGDLRIIGATTQQESRSLDNDPAFKRRMTVVSVAELEKDQTASIVESALNTYMDHHKNLVTVDKALAPTIVDIADEKVTSAMHRPDNALTLIDRAMSAKAVLRSSLIKQNLISSDTPVKVTQSDIDVMADRMMTSDAQINAPDFKTMEHSLRYLRDQEGPTQQILTVLRRDNLNLVERVKPLSFMLPGSSGVGKTETANIISQHLTGMKPIRLNMTEYSSKMSITKLIGSSAGYVGSNSNREMPLDPLRMNPRRVLLLDEIEKADTEVQHLFLSALDTGQLDLAKGETLDLRKTIIIATTNAARDIIGKPSAFGFDDTNLNQARMTGSLVERTRITKALEKYFSPEFLGRFTQIIPFNRISENAYIQIIKDVYTNHVKKIIDRSPSLGNQLTKDLPHDVAIELAKQSYLPDLGARPAQPLIENLIGDILDPAGVIDGTPTAQAVEMLNIQ